MSAQSADTDFSRFQSTPSVGRATPPIAPKGYRLVISIHALRGEGDASLTASAAFVLAFQSTPSVGRATQGSAIEDPGTDISIHALRGEGDCKNIQICNAMLVHSAYKTIYFCDSCAFYLT